MSFLFGAFLAGALAIAFPLVFHLIRRTPKGQQAFSSLMFLKPTPPRLTRRSRLDDLLLLLLRALAILLLVAAFMRPYWQTSAELSVEGVSGRRVAVLLDTSASMGRGDLWQQALGQAEAAIDELSPADQAALYTFADEVEPIVGFPEQLQENHSQQHAVLKDRLRQLSPSSGSTLLGEALVRIAEEIQPQEDQPLSRPSLQMIVITDLQRGSSLDSLQRSPWPESIRVAVHQVNLADNSNASIRLLEPTEETDSTDDPLVRVTNAADSTIDQFQVQWAAGDTAADTKPVPFYVPPGQSRVLRVPREQNALAATKLIVSGDSSDFDNTQYIVPVRQQEIPLAYLGPDDRNDPEGMRFYLERAYSETPRRKVKFISPAADQPLTLLPGELPQLIVITGSVSSEHVDSVRRYVAGGGTALVVLDRDSLDSVSTLLPNLELDDTTFPADENDYRLLGEIDFSHRLFATFANPRYNDFTNIRFWNYCPVRFRGGEENTAEGEAVEMIARFDNGKPALWQQSQGEGTYYVLTSGWHPRESQLALSNKFVPIMEELLALSREPALAITSYTVGDSIRLPVAETQSPREVIDPTGTVFKLASTDETFSATQEPGIYQFQSAGEQHAFAVNLASSESDTQPLDVDRLEQLGVKLGMHATQAEELDRLRQLRKEELENSQKIWKWLIVAALLVLALETAVAAWRSRQMNATQGEPA